MGSVLSGRPMSHPLSSGQALSSALVEKANPLAPGVRMNHCVSFNSKRIYAPLPFARPRGGNETIAPISCG